jgi:[acyl-carrier-protein] S-malonyltransferase
VARSVRRVGQLEVAIRNAPDQYVIAGERRALEAALAILEEEHFVQGMIIEDRIPMHTQLFRPAAESFRPALEAIVWGRPALPYLPNVLGRVAPHPGPEQFVELLSLHVCSPVLWRESIDFLTERDADLAFVEVGPRAVLYNLLGKRWKSNTRYKTDSPDDLPASFMILAEELARGMYGTPIAA